MKSLLFAVGSILGLLGLADSAGAYTLPNGNVVWNLSTAAHDIRLEMYAGVPVGSITFTTRATGVTQIGSLNPAVVLDRTGGADEFTAEGLFDPFPSLVLDISLVDLDGAAFDGAPSTGGGSIYGFPPVDPPPLATFETAEVRISVQVQDQFGNPQFLHVTETITALPEPATVLLALPLIGIALSRRQFGQ